MGFLGVSDRNNWPVLWETRVWSLESGRSLEEAAATHSSSSCLRISGQRSLMAMSLSAMQTGSKELGYGWTGSTLLPKETFHPNILDLHGNWNSGFNCSGVHSRPPFPLRMKYHSGIIQGGASIRTSLNHSTHRQGGRKTSLRLSCAQVNILCAMSKVQWLQGLKSAEIASIKKVVTHTSMYFRWALSGREFRQDTFHSFYSNIHLAGLCKSCFTVLHFAHE